MGFILQSGVAEFLCLVLVVLWAFYKYVTWKYGYWRARGVPCVDGVFPLGTLTGMSLGQMHVGEDYDRCCRKFRGERFFGIIDGREPTLVVQDPELIKSILTKDFRHFTDRLNLPEAAKKEYIAQHLFNLSGQEWRDMRLTLTPTFTSGKMKMMFSLMEKCCDQLGEHMDKRIAINSTINIKDVLARFTMDIIASCAFGLDINSLSETNNEFYKIGSKIFKTTKFRMVRRLWYGLVPVLSKLYAPPLIPTEIAEFFTKLIRDTLYYREQNGVMRNDFLDLLIKIRHTESVSLDDLKTNGQAEPTNNQPHRKALTIQQMAAQSFVFFGAGFETASSTASFCLYELTRHPQVQERLHQEITQVLAGHGGNPTYQALQNMTYMDQVVNETLRLYASLAVLNRICTEAYKIPDTDLVLQKGTKITIPVYSIHHNPDYYPDPSSFDPERFAPERVRERHPYLYLPFGEGPRMCIGMRFGLLQTKIALTTMVSKYQFALTPSTEVPVTLNKTAFVTQPEKPILLQVSKRSTRL